MKQKIQFTGKNIDEIFALPCVDYIKKSMFGDPVVHLLSYNDDGFKQDANDLWSRLNDHPYSQKEFNDTMDAFLAKYPRTVKIDDCLIEQDDGSWRVEKGNTNEILRCYSQT